MENIVIKNPEEFERIKKEIAKGGAQNLHILADFDGTLTSGFTDGKIAPPLLFLLYNGNYLSKEYNEKAQALHKKYRPIESDPNIPEEEKKKAMEEWWRLHFDLLIKSGLNKKEIKSVVYSGKVKLRSGSAGFFDFLHEKNIPLVIMSSSGLGADSIAMFLKKEGRLYDNIHIISNVFEWDSRGNAVGVKEPIIHGMNKDETLVKNFPAFETIKNRRNVLLLGNAISDIGMVEGFDCAHLLKLGFLNEDAEKNLLHYKNNFDAVILNDGPMDFINNLLKEIVE